MAHLGYPDSYLGFPTTLPQENMLNYGDFFSSEISNFLQTSKIFSAKRMDFKAYYYLYFPIKANVYY